MINTKLISCLLALVTLGGCVSQADIKLRNEAAQERRQERIIDLEKAEDGSGGSVYLSVEMSVGYTTSRSSAVTRAYPSVPHRIINLASGEFATKDTYGGESEGFTVKIPLELGERFCLISSNVTLSKTMNDRSFKRQCAISLLATENRRRYIRISDLICGSCYGGTKHFNDPMIDNFYNTPSKNPMNKVLPTLLSLPFGKKGEQMKRDTLSFVVPPHKNYGYVYDEAQFYALSDLSYEKEFLISTEDKD